MGAGASSSSSSSSSSSAQRLRKALVIRAYNLRKKDETLQDQFRKFAYVKSPTKRSSAENSTTGGGLYISMENIKSCLNLTDGQSDSGTGSDTSSWVDDLFMYTLGADVSATSVSLLSYLFTLTWSLCVASLLPFAM